jgi:hypothetical protein
MRSECLNHKFVYESPVQVERLVSDVADKHQEATQSYVRRPYGVGLLVAGYDRTGPHLFQTDPSGNYYEFLAMAMGSRSQTAKTYLEKNHGRFPDREGRRQQGRGRGRAGEGGGGRSACRRRAAHRGPDDDDEGEGTPSVCPEARFPSVPSGH